MRNSKLSERKPKEQKMAENEIAENEVDESKDDDDVAEGESLDPSRPVVDILDPETCPNALKDFYTADQRQAIRDRIADGSVVSVLKRVKMSAKSSGTSKAEYWPYISYRAVRSPGMTALAGGRSDAKVKLPDNYKDLSDVQKKQADNRNQDGACDYFNYGYVLTISAPIRNFLSSKIENPEKAIDKAVAQIMKTGLFKTKEAALAVVIRQRQDNGMPLPAAYATASE